MANGPVGPRSLAASADAGSPARSEISRRETPAATVAAEPTERSGAKLQRSRGGRPALPTTSFVDGFLCAASVLLILILVRSLASGEGGTIPQADIVLSCAIGAGGLDAYETEMTRPNAAPESLAPDEVTSRIVEILQDWEGVHLRIGLRQSPTTRACAGRLSSALEAAAAETARDGGAAPIVEILFDGGGG